MIELKIKPLSSNDAWKGRRFKTEEYKNFEKELMYLLLPKLTIPKEKLKVWYEFGLSNRGADGDNCIKQFQDVIAKKYNFNDKNIYEWNIKKVDVKKGEEYIKFLIKKNTSQ